MDCYKKMYFRLFNKITDVINDLQVIQAETEELSLLREEIGEGEQSSFEDTN